MKTVILSLILCFFSSAWAAPEPTDPCEIALTAQLSAARSGFEIIPSDRVPGEAEKFRPYIKELTEPGGVLDRLGIRMTGQIVQFMQGRDLNAITSGTAGGHPVAHPLDGSAVLDALRPKGGFALEVVYPGPKFQHGFYRDDNPRDQQISIIDHVVGHNHFALFSGFPHYRAAQGLLASRELDDLLKSLYKTYNKDEVQRFYTWALTLLPLIDWYTPYYQDISEFEPKLAVTEYDPLGRTQQRIKRHPKATTENVMAAIAANIAPHEPPWKRRMLELMYQSMAFRPALVHTQIMNEGWASIMQEILPRFTKEHHNFTFWFHASQVMQSERQPNLRDPYSLGVACWRRLVEKFMARAEVKALPDHEAKYRAFIHYAENEVIARMDDSQFLRYAMDQVFLDRFKLAVVRKAEPMEFDHTMPRPPSQQPITQWTIVTRDREKVVQAVIDMVIKPKYSRNPRVKLVDFNRPETGEVELVLNDEVANDLAIEKSTMAPALYAIAQYIGKPVSLDCNIAELKPQPPRPSPAVGFGFFGGAFHRPEPEQEPEMVLARVRVTVSPSGDVRVFRIAKLERDPIPLNMPETRTADAEKVDEALTLQFAGILKDYLQDFYLDDPNELDRIFQGSAQMQKIKAQVIAQNVNDLGFGSLLVHSPNAAGAIAEYQSAVERRLLHAMDLAAQGRGRMVFAGGKVRVKALPSIVELGFDREYLKQAMDKHPAAPVDGFHVHRTLAKETSVPQGAFGDFQGGDGSVGGIDGQPGDKFWGPDRPPGGEQGTKPGEDPNDLSWVDIPPDIYAKFLGERVKLPVLNPKPGQSMVKKQKLGGRINRFQGQALPMEIAQNAFGRGVEEMIRQGGDPFGDVDQTFAEGFQNLQPRDWVVSNKRPTKRPEVKAVVTFVLDGSGSVGRYLEAFKMFVHDIETLIASNYKGFAFRYILFDTEAHVLKSKDELFKAQLGGGTMYVKGLNKAQWLYNEEYPRGTWDRYTFLMGDMEDFSPEDAIAKIREMLGETEFMGLVAGLHWPDGADNYDLVRFGRQEAPNNKGLGITILNEDGSYELKHIKEVLKNEDEP